jgi:hypothetical protein
MIGSQKKIFLLLARPIGFAVVLTLFVLLGMTATVQAAPDFIHLSFTDTTPIQYTDLSGNILGDGVLLGDLRCVGENCSQRIEFEPTGDTIVLEYRLKSRQAFDPAAERVVASGTGTMLNNGSRIKFSFTGIFQNNGDGTIQVTYTASIPDASFIFPAVPGTFSFTNNN